MAELTQRELQLLRQQLMNEKVCIGKYKEYATRAEPALSAVLCEIAADEEKHSAVIDGLISSIDSSGTERPRARDTGSFGEEKVRPKNSGGFATVKSAVPVDSFGRQNGVIVPSQPNPVDANPAAFFTKWKGGKAEPNRSDGAVSTCGRAAGVTSTPAHSGGPVSIPSLHMEAAEEWDGVDLSPWANLTSPSPLDADAASAGEYTRRLTPENANSAIDTASILTDAIMTERFLSDGYDAAIFESENPEVRKAFQDIQRDEQRHGERLQKELKKAKRHEITELT